jgi:hypothetical protein
LLTEFWYLPWLIVRGVFYAMDAHQPPTSVRKYKAQYSIGIVYNNFPWPSPTDAQHARIEQTAQAILDARARYPDCSLADLYSERMWLYPELLTAHQNNDRAVMQAYGFSIKGMTESACVAELMRLYHAKAAEHTRKE